MIVHLIVFIVAILWKDERFRRSFLESFAGSRNFDPLDAAKWRCITKTQLQKAVSNIFKLFDYIIWIVSFREERQF
jgi:hypothetical protein